MIAPPKATENEPETENDAKELEIPLEAPETPAADRPAATYNY
jgi:hypothetical protein